MLKNLFVAVVVLFASINAMALNPGQIKVFATAAALEASNHREGSIGYAQDTDAFYFRTGSTWTSVATLGALANGATLTNAVDGTIVVTEGGETWTWAVTNNLYTFASDSGATFVFTPASTFSGDVTFSGGAGALTCGAAGCSLVATDASATGFIMGAAGATAILTLDTTDASPKVIVTGITTQDAFSVPVGESVFVEGIRAPVVATSQAQIRFCGNGADGATPVYMGPVLLDDTEADLAFGGAGCDGLENTTEATADNPWHAGFAFKPVAMSCVGLCTGASAANDAVAFQLRDDAASVTGLTCTTPILGGDGVPSQCSVRDSSPATVAANSAVAVSVTLVDDDCNDAGDDFECILTISF